MRKSLSLVEEQYFPYGGGLLGLVCGGQKGRFTLDVKDIRYNDNEAGDHDTSFSSDSELLVLSMPQLYGSVICSTMISLSTVLTTSRRSTPM